jgi:hypothetical protein
LTQQLLQQQLIKDLREIAILSTESLAAVFAFIRVQQHLKLIVELGPTSREWSDFERLSG